MDTTCDISTEAGRSATLQALASLGTPGVTTDQVAAAVAAIGPAWLLPHNGQDLDEMLSAAFQSGPAAKGAELVLNCLTCVGTGVRQQPHVVLAVRGQLEAQRGHRIEVVSGTGSMQTWLSRHLRLPQEAIVVHPKALDPRALALRPSELLLEVQTLTSLYYLPESVTGEATVDEPATASRQSVFLFKLTSRAFEQRMDDVMDPQPSTIASNALHLPYFLPTGRQALAQFIPDFVGLPWRACQQR